jgi:glycosyltransferase involved in cell wall biosynthesis
VPDGTAPRAASRPAAVSVRLMRLVFVTQRIDPDDPVLGATVGKVSALAERVDEVAVLAGDAVAGVLPGNCRNRSFAARTKVGRGLRFERALAAELRTRPDAVICHMCPIYVVLAAPLTKPLHVPLLLWWTHWRRTRLLAAAARLVDRIPSVDRISVPLESAKVTPIGHGIDMDVFSCGAGRGVERDGQPLVALVLGRYSSAKGLATVVRAVHAARAGGLDVVLRCHGTATTPAEAADRRSLAELVDELALGDAISLGGPVPRSSVPALLRAADVLVNNMRAGAADKVVFEAAASCLPVLASNPSFASLLDGLGTPLRFDRDDPSELAERLAGLVAAGAQGRRALGRILRERVASTSSTASWADGIVRIVEELA